MIADSVNSGTYSLELVRELDRQEKGLELANKFEFLWEDLDTSGYLEGINEAYFLIGSHAGFTDTRIVFMWLKSWIMFDSTKSFYIKRILFDVPIDFVEPVLLQNLLLDAKTENNSSEISYSKEPNITKKL